MVRPSGSAHAPRTRRVRVCPIDPQFLQHGALTLHVTVLSVPETRPTPPCPLCPDDLDALLRSCLKCPWQRPAPRPYWVPLCAPEALSPGLPEQVSENRARTVPTVGLSAYLVCEQKSALPLSIPLTQPDRPLLSHSEASPGTHQHSPHLSSKMQTPARLPRQQTRSRPFVHRKNANLVTGSPHFLVLGGVTPYPRLASSPAWIHSHIRGRGSDSQCRQHLTPSAWTRKEMRSCPSGGGFHSQVRLTITEFS